MILFHVRAFGSLITNEIFPLVLRPFCLLGNGLAQTMGLAVYILLQFEMCRITDTISLNFFPLIKARATGGGNEECNRRKLQRRATSRSSSFGHHVYCPGDNSGGISFTTLRLRIITASASARRIGFLASVIARRGRACTFCPELYSLLRFFFLPHSKKEPCRSAVASAAGSMPALEPLR